MSSGAPRCSGGGAGTFEITWSRQRPDVGAVRDGHSLHLKVLGERGLVGLLLVATAILAILVGLAGRVRDAICGRVDVRGRRRHRLALGNAGRHVPGSSRSAGPRSPAARVSAGLRGATRGPPRARHWMNRLKPMTIDTVKRSAGLTRSSQWRKAAHGMEILFPDL